MSVTLHSVNDADKTAVITPTGADLTTVQAMANPADGGRAGKRNVWALAVGSGRYLISNEAARTLGVATVANGLGSAAASSVVLPLYHAGLDLWAVNYSAATAAGKAYLDALAAPRPGRQTEALHFSSGTTRWISGKAYTAFVAANI